VVRPANPPMPDQHAHPIITDFGQIVFAAGG
jgi:hypothetical protein